MTDFQVVEFGYNIADETINFGTRCLADGDNLYEASTLATLRCSEGEEGKINPHLNAIVQNDLVFFSVNASLKIFKDKQCSDIIFNAGFDSVVDCFCLSPEGDYLLMCLRSGMLHVIDCNDDYQSVFSALCERDEDCDRFFTNSFAHGDRFLIVAKTGRAFEIELKREFTLEPVHEFNFETEIASLQYPFLLVSGARLAVLDLENNSAVACEGCTFRKIFPLTHMFLALDFEGNLFGICALTLLIFPINNPIFCKDMQLLSDANQKQLIVVAEDESRQNFIRLLSYPDLTDLYSLKVPNEIHLISLESPNDEILYVSKITNEGAVTELRFHVVYETEPKQRLHRLLRKRKYEEAEKFATLFKLDTSLINKARAHEIIEKTVCSSEDVDNLINLLDLIEDDEFRLQSCLDVEVFCSRFDDVGKILGYGCKLQLKKHERRLAAENLQKEVIQLMYRLDTFLTVNRGREQSVQSWLQFFSCDLIEEVKVLLKNYQIEEAKIIYSRLDEETCKTLTEDSISDILNVLNNIPIADYEPFLPVFIPVTLLVLPSALPLFVKWTYSKVFHLEKRAESYFPNNAIKFTENIVGLMRVGDSVDISFQRQCILHRDSLLELSTLLSTLKTLETLKDEYRISIPVTNYLSGPQNVVRFLLNIEMCPEDYDAFLKHFLCKYMVENDMEPNEILLDEITDLMKYEERYWVNVIGSILNCISSVGVRLRAVKTVLDFATVPWSDTVRDIANRSLEYSHALTSEIRDLIKDEPMQVVLRKPKYRLVERTIGNVNDLKFILKRILYCNEPTMVEDVYELCRDAEKRHVANFLLITHFIGEGAIELLDDNTPEEVASCARELAAMVETVVNNEATGLSSEQLTNNYYEAARSIFERLNDHVRNEFERRCNERTLNLIGDVRKFNKHFRMKTTTHELLRRGRDGIIDGVLEDALREFEAGKQTTDGVFAVCRKLSASLRVESEEILTKFCQKCGDYNVTLKTAERICEKEASSRNLCSMAVLLMKRAGTYKVQTADNSLSGFESSLFLSDNECLVDDDVFRKGLRFAEVLISKAIHEARPEEVAACMEVARWVNVSFYSCRNRETDLKRILFGDVYDWAAITPGFLTFSTIRDVFGAFCSLSGAWNNPNNVYLTRFNESTTSEDDFLQELKLLPPILESLSKEGQHFTCFKIVETAFRALMHSPNPNVTILSFLNEILKKKCIPTLLSSILTYSCIDSELFYGLLLFCDRDDAVKFIMMSLRMYKRHPRKLSRITQMGLRYWKHCNMTSGLSEMTKTLITLKWWNKFEAKRLDYDHFFKIKSEDRFEFLINSDCFDMKLVKAYCEDYNLDPVISFKFFFKKILQNWKPDYEIRTELHKRYLIVKNNEDDLLKKCQEVIDELSTDQVFNIITNIWYSINTYYYEVFIAMINILSRVQPQEDNTTKLSMLYFLKNYQRVSKPSEAEIEHWYTHFPDTQSLDVLSEFRLSFTPFLFSKQIFNIIRVEINLKTYKLWFKAINILKPYLSRNEICSFVVKDVVASGVLSQDATDAWVLYPKHGDLLREIDECVMNMNNLELTTSVVYHLVTHTPHGADQVNAARLCYKYAVEYRKMNPDSSNVERAVIKIEKKYFTYCAMHILHTQKLAEKKYMNLLTHPKELIMALYLDERILRKSEVDLHCPNINGATEALARLFNLDITKIRFDMVNSWLGDNVGWHVDLDSSVVYSGGTCGGDDNLNRIAYVCCSGEVSYWQTELLQIGLDAQDEEQRSVHCRVRALKVFAMISDVKLIMELTGWSYNDFMLFIDKLTVTSNLQYLGISLDVEALTECNKKELLNRLVQRGGNILAVKTMALICMTFEIYDVKYWEFIVISTIKLSLYAELKTYVTFLNKVKYQYKKFYINAWQKLIDHSFVHWDDPRALLGNFLTIQSCPVLHSLDFDNAFRKCMERGEVEFASVLLQYLDDGRRDEYIKEIRNSNKDLVAGLNKLDRNGLWGIPHVKALLADR